MCQCVSSVSVNLEDPTLLVYYHLFAEKKIRLSLAFPVTRIPQTSLAM